MRIVHEIDGMMQVGGGSEAPYAGSKKDGFRMHLTICTNPNYHQPWAGKEVLHIEGDAAYLLAMLQDAIDVVNLIGDRFVEDHGLDPKWREKRPKKAKRT